MSEMAAAAGTAALLGMLSALSPCSVTLTLSALSHLVARARHVQQVALAGLSMMLGMLCCLVGLAALIVGASLAVPTIALLVQKLANQVLGPVLVLVGMLHVGLLGPVRSTGSQRGFARLAKRGDASAAVSFVLGLLLAASFCPSTAGVYFGVLVPWALQHRAPVMLPLAYASGAVTPLLLCTVVIGTGSKIAARLPQLVPVGEVIQRIAGWLMIALGIVTTVSQTYW